MRINDEVLFVLVTRWRFGHSQTNWSSSAMSFFELWRSKKFHFNQNVLPPYGMWGGIKRIWSHTWQSITTLFLMKLLHCSRFFSYLAFLSLIIDLYLIHIVLWIKMCSLKKPSNHLFIRPCATTQGGADSLFGLMPLIHTQLVFVCAMHLEQWFKV